MSATTPTETTASTVTTAPDGSTTLTVSQDIAAPRARVFDLWTDPAAMMRWFGIDPERNTEMGFERRVGGAWFAAATDPYGQPMRMEGTVTAFEPPERLAQTWAFVDAAGNRHNVTEVEVRLVETAGGCSVTVLHRKILHTPERFEAGWNDSFARLIALAEAGGETA